MTGHWNDESDPDSDDVTLLLDGIPGAWERGQLGSHQASSGDTIALDEL